MNPLDDLQAGGRRELLRWLLGACRFWLTAEPADAPETDPADWNALAQFCYFHDLDPLLHHLAADSRLALGSKLPARVRQQWEAAYYRNFVFNTELLDVLASFLEGCYQRGLEVRIFKGPVTIARGWFDPALRVMADVDLICRQQDLPRLADLARALDFETGEQTATHHLALRHRTLPASFELHFQMYDVLAHPERVLERLWSQTAWVAVEDRRLPAPAPELAVVLDTAHLLQHDLQLNLKPLLDLSATLWRQRRTLDPELLQGLLAETDLAPEFRLVNSLLSETLHLPCLPDASVDKGELPPGLETGLLERLLAADRLDRVGALAGPHRREGVLGTFRYLLARFVPPLDQLQAMSGRRTPARALLGYPAHVMATARRGMRRWRASGARSPGSSLKEELFRRRRNGRTAARD